MYISTRVIYGFSLGFEVIEVQAEEDSYYNVYKLDLGFVSFNFIPTN